MENLLFIEKLYEKFPSLRNFIKSYPIRSFHVCGSGELSLLLITEDCRLYGLGKNEAGILGLGHDNPVLHEPIEIVAMRDVQIDSISSGAFHVMASTTSGQIYGWGDSKLGQCAKLEGLIQPCLLSNGESFRSVRCGYWHSMALTQDGLVLAWGDNQYCQLGGGITPHRYRPMPVKELRDKHIISIACGGWHSLALTKDGQVYVWGLNDAGQLFGPILRQVEVNQRYLASPTLLINTLCMVKNIATDVRFCAIAAGLRHSMVLTEDGQLLSCGHNNHGQLGTLTKEEHIENSIHLSIPSSQNDPFVWIMACQNYSWAATKSGRYFCWGQYDAKTNYFHPRRVVSTHNFKQTN